MIKRLRKHTISIKHAIEGIKWSFGTQPNYLIHFIFSTMAILAGAFFEISYEEFLMIIIMITVGLSIETINTAIEQACDAISLDWHENIKIAKDVGAGAMLIFSFGAIVLSSIIFIPKIIDFFNSL